VTVKDTAELDRLVGAMRSVRAEVAKSVVGQGEVVDQLLIGLLCGGHVLLEGTPGVGKTLMVRTLGAVTGLSFGRVQFTPDLMPADVTGGLMLVPDDAGHMSAKFQPGPIFSEILLADEINRAPPKTQSSLLEAMQEGTVTVGGVSRTLPKPFFVLATQNPVEMDGTYELPEAQIDRFLFKSVVRYPSEAELDTILDLTTGTASTKLNQILSAGEIRELQQLVRDVPVAHHVRRAIARIAIATQPDSPQSSEVVRKYLRFGLSPRGAQALLLAAKGHALLNGRYNVGFDDIRAIMLPVMRHRVQLSFHGEAARLDLGKLFGDLLDAEIKVAA